MHKTHFHKAYLYPPMVYFNSIGQLVLRPLLYIIFINGDGAFPHRVHSDMRLLTAGAFPILFSGP